MLVVEKFPEANTQDVTKGVEAALEGLRGGLSGVEIDTTTFRPATYVARASSNLATGLMIAAGLAVLAFGLLLGSWRAALIGLVSMATSLIAAGLVLYVYGVNLNMMVLAGLVLAIGVIIDDAIADIATMRQRLRNPQQANHGATPQGHILAAALTVRRPTLYATAILVVAALPVLLIQGASAAFFQPIVWTFLLALAVSMVVALTLTPALAALLMSNVQPSPTTGGGLIEMLRRMYERAAGADSRSLQPAMALVLIAALASVLVWRQAEHSLIPKFQETDIFVDWQGAPGTSLQAMTVATQGLVKDLRKIPGVANIGAQLGRAQLSYDIADVSEGRIWISIDPAAPYAKTVAAIQAASNSYAGFTGEVESYLSTRMHDRLVGEEDTLKVRLYGHDLSILEAKAKEVQTLIGKVEGISNPEVEHPERNDSIEVAVDLEKARRYGLKPGDVRRAASALVSGITVGSLFNDQKVVDVVAWGAAELRRGPEDMKNLMIETGDGELVRLADVADIKTGPSVSVIRHQGVSRYLDVEADVVGRPVGAVSKEVSALLSNLTFPFEYHAQVIGEQAEREDAKLAHYGYVLAAAAMIVLLLQSAFGSWRLAAVTIASLPAALLGCVLVMMLLKDASLLGGLLGATAVCAVALRNAIVMIKRFQTLEHQDGEAPDQVVARGVHELFRPIVATAIATAVVVLPFVVMGNIAGLEIVHPAAAVILGGLITTTIFSLFVIPALYARFGLRAGTDELALVEAVA